MINWNKTAELNNTTIDKLQAYFKKFPKSGKKIITICDGCEKERELKFNGYHDLCRSCVKKGKPAHNKGGTISDETKAKISKNMPDKSGKNNPFYGKKHSKESRKKISIAGKGKIVSEIQRKKQSERQKGTKRSKETKEKISKANKCKPKSEEQKKKQSETMTGRYLRENSPRWNPNITDEERLIKRQYPEYAEWRNKVYERDNYTCQICNKKSTGNLNAHHIESYNNNPELRTELDNGITLCEDCHKDFHHLYGKGNNTRSQLNEWILK